MIDEEAFAGARAGVDSMPFHWASSAMIRGIMAPQLHTGYADAMAAGEYAVGEHNLSTLAAAVPECATTHRRVRQRRQLVTDSGR